MARWISATGSRTASIRGPQFTTSIQAGCLNSSGGWRNAPMKPFVTTWLEFTVSQARGPFDRTGIGSVAKPSLSLQGVFAEQAPTSRSRWARTVSFARSSGNRRNGIDAVFSALNDSETVRTSPPGLHFAPAARYN
jgi:hypothetical protein